MKTARRILIPCLSIICCYLFAPFNYCGWALDEEGCLTCHRYPGFVRHEKADGFKVLHVDEALFMDSDHGTIRCGQCHTTVVKVPHTGETEVNCSTACHPDPDIREAIEGFDLQDFHQDEQSFITRLDDNSSCRICHPLYPHSENRVVRGFVNMHTGFMLCEVCHLKRAKFKNPVYEWTDTENADFSGEPFGTFFKPRAAGHREGEHFISRIAVYLQEKDRKRPLMNTWDNRQAQEYVQKEKILTPSEKQRQLDFFHRDIERKEISVACNGCHAADSILDFEQLGFDEKKTSRLINLNVKGLVTKYEVFYFPHQLFGH